MWFVGYMDWEWFVVFDDCIVCGVCGWVDVLVGIVVDSNF